MSERYKKCHIDGLNLLEKMSVIFCDFLVFMNKGALNVLKTFHLRNHFTD